MKRLIQIAAASIALSVPALAHAAPLQRQPYLQNSTPSEITIVWTTTGDSTGAVEWGSAPDALDQSNPSPVTSTQHIVTLTGLSAGTRYYYRIVSDGVVEAGGDEFHYFDTPPPVGTRSKLRAWVVGDSGTGGAMQGMVRDAAYAFTLASRPDIFLHMGDMAYTDGTYDEFTNRFYAMYATILRNTTVWPTLGNHEGGSSDSGTQSGPYYDGYVLPVDGEAGGLPSGTEAYYAFDHANVHFIVLDSHDSDRSPNGAMLTWAAEDLASTNQEWIVAYWHHPPYTKGSHDSDNEGQLVDMRENALPILEAGGVDLVLGGHSHIYERSFLLDGAYATPSVAGDGVLDGSDGLVLGDGPYVKSTGLSAHEGTVYIVAGHGGTGVSSRATPHPLMFVSEVANGSCMLDVQENRLTVTNVRWDGMVTDRVDVIKDDAIVIAQPNGGEAIAPQQPYAIRWVTRGNVANVKIEYSVSDGAEWTTIEDSVANTGTYLWSPPSVQTNLGLVRVSDVDDPAFFDESNAGFAMSNEIEVIAYGDVWSYFDQGQDLGPDWANPGFDANAWPSGNAQFGYGDGDEATVVVDADPNDPSVYFRKTITLPEVPLSAQLEALYDDGVAVFVNGEQVWAVNVDDPSYAAFASAASDDNEVSGGEIPVDAFVAGDNVIAVIAKQASEGSSDLSFDLTMTVTVPLDPLPPPGSDDGGSDGGADGTAGDGGTGGGTSGASTAGGSASETDGASSGADSAGAADGGDGGCGCRTSPSPTPATLLGLGLLALGVRRRRRSPSIKRLRLIEGE
jgi:MYXO-CTERM domain-containing protein